MVSIDFDTQVKVPVNMSRNARKQVFGDSDQIQHKPACTVSEKG